MAKESRDDPVAGGEQNQNSNQLEQESTWSNTSRDNERAFHRLSFTGVV